MPAKHKLSVKQAEGLKVPGIYSDGGGLYLRIRAKAGKGVVAEPEGKVVYPKSWLFIGTKNGRRHEFGLGSFYDVSLPKAREKAEEMRALLLEGRDPREARPQPVIPVEPAATFGKFAMEWLDSVEDGFSNPKHRQQWRNTIKACAASLIDMPLQDVATEHVLELLKPIWLTKAETAGRVRGRIERIIDAAKVAGLYKGENPARGRGHLDLMLCAPMHVLRAHLSAAESGHGRSLIELTAIGDTPERQVFWDTSQETDVRSPRCICGFETLQTSASGNDKI